MSIILETWKFIDVSKPNSLTFKDWIPLIGAAIIFLAGLGVSRISILMKEYRDLKNIKEYIIGWSKNLSVHLSTSANKILNYSKYLDNLKRVQCEEITMTEFPFNNITGINKIDLTRSLCLRVKGIVEDNIEILHRYELLIDKIKTEFSKEFSELKKYSKSINCFMENATNSCLSISKFMYWDESEPLEIMSLIKKIKPHIEESELKTFDYKYYNKINNVVTSSLKVYEYGYEEYYTDTSWIEIRKHNEDLTNNLISFSEYRIDKSSRCHILSIHYNNLSQLLNFYILYFKKLALRNQSWITLNWKGNKYTIAHLNQDLIEYFNSNAIMYDEQFIPV